MGTKISKAGNPKAKSLDDAVVLTVRIDRKTSELLDALAGLYGTTKTDIVRDAIIDRAGEMATEEAVETAARHLQEEMTRKYQELAATFGATRADPPPAESQEQESAASPSAAPLKVLQG